MRKVRSILGIPVVLMCVGLILSSLSFVGEVSAAKKIVFGFDWVPYGKYVGYYAAREKGFYKAAGFDVSFQRGYGGRQHTGWQWEAGLRHRERWGACHLPQQEGAREAGVHVA